MSLTDEDNVELTSDQEAVIQELEDLDDSIQEPVATYKTKYLSLLADMENMRKRFATEKDNAVNVGYAKGFASVLKVYEILTQAAQTEGDSELITFLFKEINKVLDENDVSTIEPEEGSVFSDEYHSAMLTVPTDVHELKGKISQCLRPGFSQGDNIIKYADVAVYR